MRRNAIGGVRRPERAALLAAPGRFLRSLAANLGGGARLLLLVPRPSFCASVSQLLALLALGWLCAALADYADPARRGAPAAAGIAFELARGYVWLLALAAIAATERGGRYFLRLAVACAAADVWLWLAWIGLGAAAERFMAAAWLQGTAAFWWLLFGWQIAVFARALALARGGWHWRVPVSAVLYAAVLYFNLELMPDAPLFQRTVAPEAPPPINVEGTYYQQAFLLDRALDDLAPQRPGSTDWYFVGFAGYGAEAVFRREVQQVRDIVGDWRGTRTRSVLLVNSPDTVTDLPLANGPNLAYVLAAIGQRMDPAEDVLFLFLTSHGLETGELVVELEPLGLNNLTPEALRDALDTAGIRWRVLVVSACFSGAFLDELASPTTLVITAAADDKSSFGCAHENHWTYFGEAFFAGALRETNSPVQAFVQARASIEAREAAEGKEPSEPQMRLGSEIEARFPEWRAD